MSELGEPTRVTYTDWEGVYGPDHIERVPIRWEGVTLPMFGMFRRAVEWKNVHMPGPCIGYQRYRMDHWETKGGLEPVFAETGPSELTITQRYVAPTHRARKVKELVDLNYDPVDHLDGKAVFDELMADA